MSSPMSANLEAILDRFDDAWNGPTPPLIEDYLKEAAADQRIRLLIELVRIDLERRLAAGEKVRLENIYLPRFPELFVESPAILTLVKHEFTVRRRNEPGLMPEEYLERFPQCQTELLAQLPTLDEIRDGERQAQPGDAPVGLDPRGYELIETLGKGGMGEVYRCGDPALGRDLAIKVMKEAHRAYPEIESRFLREARVTASLQHPGIVPVYNLGRLRDGRLHYTMRLVRGQTFAAILKEEAGKVERLPYLLSIFEKICQAVAYAHNKQVIHRDLKPANVMVGRFGEVQVMDWGLAKLLTAGEEPVAAEGTIEREGTRIHTEAEDTPLAQTRMGREMGTPSYMPPEQALGEWDMVDEHADVFALGAILCEMLTGKPAYSGTDSSEVFRRAKRGDVAEALQRLQQCGADAALTALCRECLSPNRDDRPRDAAVVAERVAMHQAEVQERLRQAEVERAEAQAKAREERKRRRWVVAFLLVLLAGAALSTWQAVRATIAEGKARDNERQAEAAAEGERHARESESLQRKLAEEQKGRAENKEREARERQADTEAVLKYFRDKVLSAGRPKDQEGGLGRAVMLQQAVDAAEPEIAKSFANRPLVEASIREALGETYWHLGEYPSAIKQDERALALLEAHLGTDHPTTLTSRGNLAAAYVSAGRPAEAIRLYEQNLRMCEGQLGAVHPRTLVSRSSLAEAYRRTGRSADAIRLHEQNLKMCESTFGPDHRDTLMSLNNLASAYWSDGRTTEAVHRFEQILRQMEAKLGPDHLDTLMSRNNLALTYGAVGRVGDAIRLLEQTLKQREAKLGPDHPHTLVSRSSLAEAYRRAGRIPDSIRLNEQTLKQMEAKLGLDHPHTLASRNNLALAYSAAGRTTEALGLLEQTLKQSEAERGPEHPETLISRGNLAEAYVSVGRNADAIRLGEQNLKMCEAKLIPEHPTTLRSRNSLALAYDRAEQFGKSESLYRVALDQARKRFGDDDPRTTGQMAILATNLLYQHRYAEAESLLRDCLKIREGKQPDLWTTFNTRSALGEASAGQKKYNEAEPLLLQGYEGMKAREAKIPPQGKVRLIEALERLVRLYEATEQKDKATAWRKKLQETKAAQKKPKA